MEEGKGWYVGWEEVVVSNDKGRRVVHYYLKDAAGGADLAIVGREKSLRHMSYAAPAQFLRSVAGGSPAHRPSPPSSSSASPPAATAVAGVSLKWRSRREVIDWLSAVVSDPAPYRSSPTVDRLSDDDDDDEPTYLPTPKGVSLGKTGHLSKDFSWLGSAWNCRKRRKHYRSFCRNGVTISVHDFVYVMAEENKRLVAYVEDLYEDLRANHVVVVRWFHKVDEVGIVLPPDVNDREIFFSLCLQDFNVECVDGLAAVLSAQHFEKFQNEARHTNWEPYLCRRQIDNDDVKPFDITQVQGYWSQELLRTLFSSSMKLRLKITYGGSSLDEFNGHVPRDEGKKHRAISGNVGVVGTDVKDKNKLSNLGVNSKAERHFSSAVSAPGLLREELFKRNLQQQLSPGCHVEVLSQDSGIRGCWFRCLILKRHRDKVKVQYQDVQDAEETANLEEWVLLSRVAAPDKLGIRLCGRPIVRPHHSRTPGESCIFDVGAVVDAWWHDGWWEGIVIRKECEGQFHVYFPGEKQASIFRDGDLRHSQDWISNKWIHMRDRKDIVISLLSDLESQNKCVLGDVKMAQNSPSTKRPTDVEPEKEASTPEDNVRYNPAPTMDSTFDGLAEVPDLAKYCKQDGLQWSTSKKRKRRRDVLADDGSSRDRKRCEPSSGEEVKESNSTCGGFVLPKSLTVDHENCKIGGDPLFNTPMTLSSLVMSR